MRQIITLVLTLTLLTSGMPVKLKQVLVVTDEKQELLGVEEFDEDFKNNPSLYGHWGHSGYSRMFLFGRKENGVVVSIANKESGMVMLPDWKETVILKPGMKAYKVKLSSVPGKTVDNPEEGLAPGGVALYWVKPVDGENLLDTEFSLILPVIDEEDTKKYVFIFQ